MRNTSNARVIKALKLLNMINFSKNYELTKIYNNSKKFKSDHNNQNLSSLPNTQDTSFMREKIQGINFDLIAYAITKSDFDNLYIPCISSKQTWTMIHKPMTKVKKKLKEVNINLWGLYNPLLLSGNIYMAILLDVKIHKTWVTCLYSKDKFVNVF